MIKTMRVVFDTNVYLSAVLFGGVPRKVLDLAQEKTFDLYVSVEILWEIVSKLQDKFLWSENDIHNIVVAITKMTTMVKPDRHFIVVSADHDDDKIIDCAYASRSDYIVTGDDHLLRLRKWKKITILSPANFWIKCLA